MARTGKKRWDCPDIKGERGVAGLAGVLPWVVAPLACLLAAKSPLRWWASGAAIWSGAAPALQAFVDQTGIPFYATPQGRGAIPEDHAYCYLSARNVAFREADLVMIVGTRLNYVIGHARPPKMSASAKFIR